MPSPLPEHPGLLVRDPLRFTDATLVIPPPIVPLLALFDGRHDELDLAAAVVRATGELQVQGLVRQLVDTLSAAGVLQDAVFERMREERSAAFARSPRREASHAGSAYPDEPDALADTLRRYLDGASPDRAPAPGSDGLIGIAAPHVSPEGGWRCYREAYGALARAPRPRAVVVLGTSHYGEPERFGLTRKPFRTPLGETPVDVALVDLLEAEGGSAVKAEDYCHAVEHSIEFQVVFLQHLLGPGVPIVPVLCGPFARAASGGAPEDDPGVARFLGALAALGARHGRQLLWVLGVDLAHVGRRYGDPVAARADRAEMVGVAGRDQARLARVAAGDAAGFWELVREGGDDLRWCGSSPLYAFLRAAAPVRGEVLRYEQWNIDRDSVVSFAGLSFSRPA
jgi:AmmeMemoRadiSam system protein B